MKKRPIKEINKISLTKKRQELEKQAAEVWEWLNNENNFCKDEWPQKREIYKRLDVRITSLKQRIKRPKRAIHYGYSTPNVNTHSL